MAVPPLQALAHAGFEIALVVTRADKRRGRGSELSPSPVKAAAAELGLPVSHRVDDVLEVGADLGVVVAFGQIIKPHVLAKLPMVNLHFSLLPRWRGAAPVERALLAGDAETGVDLMVVEEGLDTGGIYARRRLPIGPEATLASLREELVAAGTDLLVEQLQQGLGEPEPQQGESTYAAKLSPEDLRLDWNRAASELDRVVRLGGAWTMVQGRRLKVLEARLTRPDEPLAAGEIRGTSVGTADGALELIRVQPESKGPMAATAWRNGLTLSADDRLGS
ncbi:MAG: fmt [Acidimicrobiia bacterium]|nr:fmt [Acidimicrobiia bacterium]